MSFNEANGDMTKHPAASIRQESSRPEAFEAESLSLYLLGDFAVSLLEWKYEMSQSVVCMPENVRNTAACRVWICERLDEIIGESRAGLLKNN